MGILRIIIATALATLTADAATITFTGATTGGDTVYNYELSLNPTDRVQAGDLFTIFDFAGFTGAHAPGFTVTTDPSYPNSSSPNLWDVSFTYANTTPLDGAAKLSLSITSTSTAQRVGDYFISNHKQNDNNKGHLRTATGHVTVAGMEVSNQFATAPVPEPASLALIGFGLLGLGLMRRHRSTRE